jgi:hypothetical protein
MVQVLRGVRSAGAIVNSVAEPQPKMRPAAVQGRAVRPLVLGDATNQLVFTPVSPCRVVDTRPGPSGNGGRTGILPANATRDFDVTAGATGSGQGGGPFPCPGLPMFSHLGWALNITVVSGFYSAAGGLKAWGFNSTEPNASVINWQAGQSGAIANGVILMGCLGCADDITIKAFGDATHVIIDVMGYFQEASATASTVTTFTGIQITIPPGSAQHVEGPLCPAGTVLLSGKVSTSSESTVQIESIGSVGSTGSPEGSTFRVRNTSASGSTHFVGSRCMDAPVIQ